MGVERILITGAAGFIGSNLISFLNNGDYEIIKIDKISNSSDIFAADILDSKIVELISSHEPDIVIHLAAQIDVTNSFLDPVQDFLVNGLGTLNVLEGAISGGVSHFIYITSGGAIYNSNQNFPIPEDGKIGPISPYGISKLAGEYYVMSLCRNSDIKWTSLALSNVYANITEHKQGVIYNFWNRLMNNQPAVINGPETTRDFIHISDVVRAISLAIQNPTNCRLNISTGIETTLIDLHKAISLRMGTVLDPVIKNLNIGEIPRSALDNTLAKKLIGWQPIIDLRNGIILSIPKEI
jgi:UDP-glucose 4-epimerase